MKKLSIRDARDPIFELNYLLSWLAKLRNRMYVLG